MLSMEAPGQGGQLDGWFTVHALTKAFGTKRRKGDKSYAIN